MRNHPHRPPEKPAPLAAYIIVALLALLTLWICGSLYSQQLSTLFRGIEPTCTIGIASATVTVQAWSASDDCQKMLVGQDDFTGINWPEYQATARNSADGAVQCEFDRGERHITIRDGGSVGTGNSLCILLGQ